MPPGIHNRIITTVARELLKPLGFQQHGRSRLWFLDLGWRLSLVDFEHSSYERGTYLNVAAMWLWHPADYYHFDYGPGGGLTRIEGFSAFTDEEQFTLEARRLAQSAVAHTDTLEREFATMDRVANRLDNQAAAGGWKRYDAGVGSALAGRAEAAVKHFRILVAPDSDTWDWVEDMRARAARLADAVEQGTFRQVITAQIHDTRRGLKLPSWDEEFTTRFRPL